MRAPRVNITEACFACEVFIQNMEIPEVTTVCETLKDLQEKVRSAIAVREANITVIRELAESVDESYYKACISKASGAAAATVGSVLGIVGFGLAFVTFGASLAVGIPGAIVGGAGAITMAGADVGHFVVNKVTKKNLEKSLKAEKEKMLEIDELAKRLERNMESLVEAYPSIGKETLWERIKIAAKSGKAIYDTYKVVDAGFDAGRNVAKVARASRVIWPTLTVAAQAASTAGLIFDLIALPFDLTVLARSSYKVYRYRTRHERPQRNGAPERISENAEKIDKLVEDLECEKDKLRQYYKDIGGE